MKRSLVYQIACAGMFGVTALAGPVQARTSGVDREPAGTDDGAGGGARLARRMPWTVGKSGSL